MDAEDFGDMYSSKNKGQKINTPAGRNDY